MASQEDKPFACSVPGCGQCFANSDHLAVHQQKHDLSLKFGSRQDVVVDQTPTPTRFLKNIEESGLFDELQTNPFDQDFKQAAQASKSKAASLGLAGGLSPSLRIQLPGSNFTLTVPGLLASQLATSQALAAANQQNSQDSSEAQEDSSQDSSVDASNQSVPKIPVAPPPNIANPEKEVPKATPPANSNASSSVKQRLREALQKKSSSTSPYYKTPYITIPATPEILQQALSTVLPTASGLTGTTYTATPPVAHTVTMETDGSGGENRDLSGEPQIRRRRKYSDTPPEEPEEKRQKFLERNRAAAMRCRQKKKVWVENLEKKAKELEQTNNQLQNEVNYLRNEVHQLKTILLAHKDCPLIISQQQQIARVIQQLGSVAPANATVEAVTKLATSQPEVNFITTSLNGPQPSEDTSSSQQLEKLVYAATVSADTAGKAEQ